MDAFSNLKLKLYFEEKKYFVFTYMNSFSHRVFIFFMIQKYPIFRHP